jgi:uncharacterized protein (DUF697 family)
MTRSLQRSTAHLADHRRLILTHSAAAALAGLVPIPYVDEQLPALIRRALIRRLARERHVDLDEDAVREIADGRVPPPGWRSLIGLAPLARSVRRSIRAAFLAFGVYRRAEAASRTFALGTLFDHYCARHHVGIGLDARAARALRERIDRTLAAPGGRLGGFAFRRGFQAALRATVRAPLELVSALTWGKLRLLRGKPRDEVEAEEVVETTIDASLAREGSFLGRAVRGVERQLAALGGGWVDGLVARFDGGPGEDGHA